MKENAGYTIRRSILFDNACGVVLGENPHAPAPFVTWRFNEQDGHRDYFWGHYHTDLKQAEADLAARAGDYQRQYRVRLVGGYRATPQAVLDCPADEGGRKAGRG